MRKFIQGTVKVMIMELSVSKVYSNMKVMADISKHVFAVLLLMTFPIITEGRILNVAKLGNDNTATGEPTKPFLSIQKAIDIALNGDTILVSLGTYGEVIDFKSKTLFLMGRYQTTKDSTDLKNTVIDGAGFDGYVVIINGINEKSEFNGFVIKNGREGGIHAIGNVQMRNLIVKENKGNGITIRGGAQKFGLENIITSLNQIHGVLEHTDGALIWATYRSVFAHSNGDAGFFFQGGGMHNQNAKYDSLFNCVSINNQRGIVSMRNIRLSFCTIKSNSQIGFSLEEGFGEMINSIAWGNIRNISIRQARTILRGNNIQGGKEGIELRDGSPLWLVYESSNMDIDPSFSSTDILDFSISTTSPVVSMGLFDNGLSNDYFGNLRPNPAGTRPDIGAYETPLGQRKWDILFSSFSPDSARTGWQIVIKGSGFSGVTGVSFGGRPARSFKVISDTIIHAVVGDGASGNVLIEHPVKNTMLSGFVHLGVNLPETRHNTFINVSNSGNDNGSTGQRNQPFRTINAAIAYAADRDTIYLHPGIYREQISTESKKLLITGSFLFTGNKLSVDSTVIDGGYGGASTVILAESELSGVTVTGGYPNGVFVGGKGGYWSDTTRISNVHVNGSLGIGILILPPFYSYVHLNSVISSDNRVGGVYNHGSNLRLQGVSSIRNKGAGYTLQGSIGTLSNCSSIGNDNGILAWTSQIDLIFSSISGNKEYGLRAHGGEVNITNSIFWHQKNTLWISADGRIISKSSIFQNGKPNASLDNTPASNLTYEATNTSVNPYSEGQSMYDLSLPDTSRAIGSATPNFYIQSDLNGSPRPNPNGSIPDIGPFESPLGKRTDPGCASFAATFNPFKDTTQVCGITAVLNAGNGYSAYAWSTRANTQSINPKSSGYYKVSVTNSTGCNASDSTYLSIVNADILQADTAICSGGTIKLSAAIPEEHFLSAGRLYRVSNKRTRIPWGPQNILTGATSVIDGASNTRTILSKLGNYAQGNYAAYYCDTLLDDGFSDWFLPSSGEAKRICASSKWITPLNGNYMHTSTEESIRDATRLYLPSGAEDCGSVAAPFKDQPDNVLPVRIVGRLTYRWSTGDTTASIQVSPDKTTIYYVTVSDGINSCRDSVKIIVNDILNYNPFPATTSVSGDSLTLDAGNGYNQYSWNTGSSTQKINVKFTGSYKVTVTNATGCSATDSVFVQFADTVEIIIPRISAVCNQIVEVPIKALAFRKILSMQGSINWNSADLRFDTVSFYGPVSMNLSAINFGNTHSNVGRLTFSWNDISGNGQTFPDSTTLFTIRFTALGSTMRSVPVSVSSTPTPLEFIDASLKKKAGKTTAGGVDITCELTITGRILTPTDHGVNRTSVTLAGGLSTQTTTTDSSGRYIFKLLPGTYTLTPTKFGEANKSNGITTFDIVLIQAHILQRTLFDAAYKVIAADVDNSSSITTSDIIYLRKLILGTDTSLPGNRHWIFVDADQTFNNTSNPFPIITTKTITNLSTNTPHTFRGIKIGDVNFDRTPLLDQAPSADTLQFFTEWVESNDGSLLLKIKTRSISNLLGYQTTLRWDASLLRFDGIIVNPTTIGIGQRWIDEGYITLSWNDPQVKGLSFQDGMLLLEIRFNKIKQFDRTIIRLSEDKLAIEAFNSNFQRVALKLQSTEVRGDSWDGVMRVYPNPAGRKVNVDWRQNKRGTAIIRLVDANGSEVYRYTNMYDEGQNHKEIYLDERRSRNTLLLQLKVDEKLYVRKIIVVDKK